VSSVQGEMQREGPVVMGIGAYDQDDGDRQAHQLKLRSSLPRLGESDGRCRILAGSPTFTFPKHAIVRGTGR
jgi:hypothetical protein